MVVYSILGIILDKMTGIGWMVQVRKIPAENGALCRVSKRGDYWNFMIVIFSDIRYNEKSKIMVCKEVS